jgi:hypothetical protein
VPGADGRLVDWLGLYLNTADGQWHWNDDESIVNTDET